MALWVAVDIMVPKRLCALYSVRPLMCFAFVCWMYMNVRLTYPNTKQRRENTYPRCLAGQRTSSVIDRIGWVQNILIPPLVLSRDCLFPKDGRIVRWGRVRAWWWEVLLDGLLEGIIAWEVAELSLWSGKWEYNDKEGKNAYVSGLVHVTDPSSVDIESCG